MNKFLLTLIFTFGSIISIFAQVRFVNASGSCSGVPCYTTIQDAINSATAGDTILVDDGTYNENVMIDKSIVLLSENGRGATSIVGSNIGLGTVLVLTSVTNVQIGALGQGFSIVGYDNPSPASERSAIYLQGMNENITIIDNEAIARGEYALLTVINAFYDNITIDRNTFSGTTFDATQNAACAGNQFAVNNYPRQLVTINRGGGASYTNGFRFTNNQIIGVSGTTTMVYNPGGGTCPNGAGNSMVTIDAQNAVIDGNSFQGTTARFGSSLRVRGMGSRITNNCFSSDGFLSPINSFLFYGDGQTANALSTAGNQTADDIAAQNVYFGPNGDAFYDSDGTVSLQYYITPISGGPFVNNANNDCNAISSPVCRGTICPSAMVVASVPTLSEWTLLLLALLLIILGAVRLYNFKQTAVIVSVVG